jgi:hypothetical protein
MLPVYLPPRVHAQAKYSGFLNEKLFAEFEELFTSGDGARLDLDALSGADVDTVRGSVCSEGGGR